ncbi:hypothetical protein BDP67DRAFT_98800 [Colletotrichum lupini]|nr:hypothetical protein BDP67DRAFT_98800 [Colletotrichum lupini]
MERHFFFLAFGPPLVASVRYHIHPTRRVSRTHAAHSRHLCSSPPPLTDLLHLHRVCALKDHKFNLTCSISRRRRRPSACTLLAPLF